MRIHVGTSGYQYAHWNNGAFYPRGVKDRLAYALSRMNALEINSSFYSIPKPDTVASWADKMPDGAKIILKAPQSVSHRRRLKLHSDPEIKQGVDLLNYFIDGYLRIPPAKRGPALLQLPGRMEIDLARLEPVLALFAQRELSVALEVRHASWFDRSTFALLEKYNTALVASDWHEFASPLIQTAHFLYVRRHGPTSMYDSLYSQAMLLDDIALLSRHSANEAYVLFNNDIHAYAPINAMQMIGLLSAQEHDSFRVRT